MLEFNNTHIFTGYIKQLLASFNLPKYKVYTKEQAEYFEKYKTEYHVVETLTKNTGLKTIQYIPYIRFGQIQEYIDGSWVCTKNQTNAHEKLNYIYNEKQLNHTKNLKIKNNIYDYYTHEYLGDFLRFQRDYNNLDLMSLYNCFNDRICSKLDFTSSEYGNVPFNADDNKYKIYMIPVKIFNKYTIAIDSDLPIEICCGLYGKYQDARTKFMSIPKLTYKKYSKTKFSSPELYEGVAEISDFVKKEYEVELAQNECDLKMFVKVPINNTSSIVILEGDYRSMNDTSYKIKATNTSAARAAASSQGVDSIWERKTNHSIINYDHIDDDMNKFISPLQLLKMNTGKSHPFADRLVEYLTGNAITPQDEIADDIRRVQQVMKLNDIWPEFDGLWDEHIRPIVYDYMVNHASSDVNHDILGYVDRDVEKLYKHKDVFTSKDITILNVDIYPEIYTDDKK